MGKSLRQKVMEAVETKIATLSATFDGDIAYGGHDDTEQRQAAGTTAKVGKWYLRVQMYPTQRQAICGGYEQTIVVKGHAFTHYEYYTTITADNLRTAIDAKCRAIDNAMQADFTWGALAQDTIAVAAAFAINSDKSEERDPAIGFEYNIIIHTRYGDDETAWN